MSLCSGCQSINHTFIQFVYGTIIHQWKYGNESEAPGWATRSVKSEQMSLRARENCSVEVAVLTFGGSRFHMLLLRRQMHCLTFRSMPPASPVNQHLTTVADELESRPVQQLVDGLVLELAILSFSGIVQHTV